MTPINRDSMHLHNEQLEFVQRQVALGEYRVDCHQVAAAILERLRAGATERGALSAAEGGRVPPPALSDPRAI